MRVIDSADADAARAAAAAVREGSLVVLPTDTVYGVGADPRSPRAVDRLLTAKGRGRDKPSPVLVASAAQAEGLDGCDGQRGHVHADDPEGVQ